MDAMGTRIECGSRALGASSDRATHRDLDRTLTAADVLAGGAPRESRGHSDVHLSRNPRWHMYRNES